MKIKKLLLCMSLGVVAVAMSACSKSQSTKNDSGQAQTVTQQQTSTKDQVLTVGVGAAVPTLDPGILSDISSFRVANDLYEGLVTLNQKDEIIPGVAQSWDVSPDGKTYTFHLRHDAKWSNGDPVTAENFVYAFRRNLNPEVPNVFNTMYEAIVGAPDIINGKSKDFASLGVKAIDNYTLQISLSHPQPYFIQLMLMPSSYPLHKAEIEKYGQGWAQPGKMVSNGAYVLKEWVPNGHLLAVKNPYYWDKKHVAIETVKYLPIVDLSTEYAQFQSGNLDMTWDVPNGKSIEFYAKKYGAQLQHNTMLGNEFFWFNFKNPDLAKVDVRKALTIAVDRKAIVESVTKKGETPSYSVLADGVQGGLYKDIYKTMPSYSWVSQDMAKRQQEAKQLLEKAGYSEEHPLKFTVVYDTLQWKKELVLAVIGMWQQAFGNLIDVSLENQEWKVFLQTMNNHQFDVGLLDWKADYNDASDWVELMTCGSGNNYGQSCNQEVTENFRKAVSQKNEQDEIPYMTKAIKAAMNDYIILPLYNYSYSHLMSKRIAGFTAQNDHMNQIQSKWLHFKEDTKS
ncbi:peptide ABC transporter substrate-binding protein [Cysteiniphilum halobium]|uniref:peptide ABC transporter substrate-binding protein n=1 Tax=Cysteiniphilum halobium TaxID=2219059 RepID=UPI000E651AF4|nr:peptide ABC transporter substrate-binding protein [Cysteiniphilum halobium]